MRVEEIHDRLKSLPDSGITLPPRKAEDDFLNEEEEIALIQRAGAGNITGAQIVIEERKQGW